MTMRSQVQEYLALRRRLGFALVHDGRLLLDFAGQLDAHAQPTITTAAALAWATGSQDTSAAQQSRRLAIVRTFARHLNALDPDCQIPPPGLLPAHRHRPTPYIYTAEEIAALIHAAGTIAAPLPAATTQTMVRLLAASGLRLGEALGLGRTDVDIEENMLTVTGKNRKSRWVPLHPTTTTMLDDYAHQRDKLCPVIRSDSFFLTAGGRRPLQRGIQDNFVRLLAQAQIRTPPGRRRPRIHDLRHTFAVTTLTSWYQDGSDIGARMPVLSTFLGHAAPEATYWYLQATPELLGQAARRLEPAKPSDTNCP
jgi:integrase/recombinase XerD